MSPAKLASLVILSYSIVFAYILNSIPWTPSQFFFQFTLFTLHPNAFKLAMTPFSLSCLIFKYTFRVFLTHPNPFSPSFPLEFEKHQQKNGASSMPSTLPCSFRRRKPISLLLLSIWVLFMFFLIISLFPEKFSISPFTIIINPTT